MSRGGLGEASLSLHSSPSSLRCSELTASPSHQGESGAEDWALDGETEEPRTSQDAGTDFVNMASFSVEYWVFFFFFNWCCIDVTIIKQSLVMIVVTGGDTLLDRMSTVSKSECCEEEQEDVPPRNNKSKDKEGNENPRRPALGKCGEDLICNASTVL